MSGQPKQETPVVKTNRYNKVFGAIVFEPITADQTYERGNTVSKRLARVLVELGNTGTYVKGSIYARQQKGTTKATATFAWFGANNQTAVMVPRDDGAARFEMAEWCADIAGRYVQWAKEHNVTATAPTGDTQQQGADLGMSIL